MLNCKRLDRCNKKGGGIIIFIRDDIVFDRFENNRFDVTTPDIELLSVLIKRKFQKPLCLSGIYIPPKAIIDKAIEFLDEMGVHINKLGMEWIIGGDVNADMLDSNCKRNKKLTFLVLHIVICLTTV